MSPHFIGLINFCFLCWLLWLRVSNHVVSKQIISLSLSGSYVHFLLFFTSVCCFDTKSVFLSLWSAPWSTLWFWCKHAQPWAFLCLSCVSLLGTRDFHRAWATELKPVLLLLFLKGSDELYFHFHLISSSFYLSF